MYRSAGILPHPRTSQSRAAMGAVESRQQKRLAEAAAAGKAAATAVLETKAPCKDQSEGLPELIYFELQGRGELTRLAFAAGGVDFIDTRIREADWPALKADPASVPGKLFREMPCIQHGEKLIAQSRATAVYAAELGIWAQGRLGSNPTEVAINGATEMMVLGAHADVLKAMVKCFFGDEESKAKGKEALPGVASASMSGLERALERKTSGGPFFFSESGPTLADLACYNIIHSPMPGLKACSIDLEPYPKVCACADAVAKDPAVAGYLRRASMGMPELIYFNAPGRGQLTRLAFAAGGVAFKDMRIEMADWPAVKGDKESVPAQCFGSIPCIKHGDMLLAQSEATATYAAQLGIWKAGILGATTAEQATNRATEMMVLGAHADLQAAMYKCLFGDEDSKAKGKEALPEASKPILEGLERILARKKSGGPYFFSQAGPSLADLAVYDFIESPFPGVKALQIDLAPYPKLRAVADAVATDASIKANFKA